MFAEVKQCSVTECYYNQERLCTARAITVGSEKALCETWMNAEKQHSPKQNSALVGACHIGDCQYNQSFYCHATEDISVDKIDNKAQCSTYKPEKSM
jgi:hypothetical protein